MVPRADADVIAPYVVVLQDGVDAKAKVADLEKTHGFKADHTYASSLIGFAAKLAGRQRDALARDPAVESIHEDKSLRLSPPACTTRASTLATGVRRIGGGTRSATGVAVAVLDTGIDLSHPDLSALVGTNCVGGANRRLSAVADGHGHGTHVAGTIGGKGGIGVAPGTTVYAVKVLDDAGRGSTSQLICGIDWVTANAPRLGIRVASLSLGMPGTPDGDSASASHLVSAPGVCIRSSWPGGGYRTISGTSMAAPHVSATVALCISAGRCRGPAAAIIKQLRADAAAHGDGFAGDEHAPIARRHYGDLVWAGSY